MPVKTLFVRIDNTDIPKEVEPFCLHLDCRQMNNFYSFVGDALLGDLEDSNGTPYYRILPQAGKIISDFEQTDAKEF